MRLLPCRHPDARQGTAGPQPVAVARRDCRDAGQEPLSLRCAFADHARGGEGGGCAAGREGRRGDTPPLPIQNNRRMEKWLRFEPDRTVRLSVGKVELGQGNVTALAQIAADELDVDLARIAVLSGDTE